MDFPWRPLDGQDLATAVARRASFRAASTASEPLSPNHTRSKRVPAGVSAGQKPAQALRHRGGRRVGQGARRRREEVELPMHGSHHGGGPMPQQRHRVAAEIDQLPAIGQCDQCTVGGDLVRAPARQFLRQCQAGLQVPPRHCDRIIVVSLTRICDTHRANITPRAPPGTGGGEERGLLQSAHS